MIQIASTILEESLTQYEKRNKHLSVDMLEAEVINNACLYILRKKREVELEGHSQIDHTEVNQIIYAFIKAANNLFPDDYNSSESQAALVAIPQNCAWPGMWGFLKDYFQEKHDIDIDENIALPEHFHTSFYEIYQNNQLINTEEKSSLVKLSFSQGIKDLMVSIENDKRGRSLSPKHAKLISNNNNIRIYTGIDPDFRFTIYYDRFDGIKEFILERIDLHLKHRYL